jgi:hypothetical protein
VSKFVDRPAEIEKLEKALLSRHMSNGRQRTHILHGLGGISKTQLVVEFVRRHHERYSAVLWLDGRSEDSVMRSISGCAGRILQGQIPGGGGWSSLQSQVDSLFWYSAVADGA